MRVELTVSTAMPLLADSTLVITGPETTTGHRLGASGHAAADGTGRKRAGRAHRRSRKHRRIEPYAWLAAGAVGVGIAAAALTGSAAAYASDTADGSASASSSESSTGTSSTSTAGDDSKTTESSGGGSSSNDSSDAGGDDAGDISTDGDDGSEAVGPSSEEDVETSGAEEADGTEGSAEDAEAADEPSAPTSAAAKRAAISEPLDIESAAAADEAPTASSASADSDATSESSVSASIQPVAVNASPTVSSGTGTAAAAPAVLQSAAPTTVPVAVTQPLVAPRAAAAPAAPRTLAEAVAAFFRRLQSAWANARPTASPWQDPGQSSLGVVTGNVGVFDADFDPLTVALSKNPLRGTVVVNTDGTFTYTPTRMLANAGGSDTFTVVVRETNAGAHLHGLASLWTPRNSTCAVQQVVTVTITRIDSGPGSGPVAELDTQQRGFTLPAWRTGGYDGSDVEQSLSEIKELGATWVQLTPTWWQQDRYTSEITSTAGTVSDAGLERAIQLAHQAGLKVLLKPHLDLPHELGDSRNNIRPTDRPSWFANYTSFITHYAEMAQHLGVEQFSVGTEMTGVTDDRAAWLDIIQAVRERYSGVVVYAAGTNWLNVPFWDAVDMIGVDAYLQLSTVPTTDVQALQRAWEAVQDEGLALSVRYGKPILFTEAGYTSQRGTTTDPSNWAISSTVSQAEQAAGYQALLTTFTGKPWWAGVHWWVWETSPTPVDFSPKGKEAEQVIRQWWGA